MDECSKIKPVRFNGLSIFFLFLFLHIPRLNQRAKLAKLQNLCLMNRPRPKVIIQGLTYSF